MTPRSPVTLAEAKAELKIPSTETQHDDEVAGLVDRAVGLLESACGRPLAYCPPERGVSFNVTWENTGGNGAVSPQPLTSPATLYVETPAEGLLIVAGTDVRDADIVERFGDDGVGAYYGVKVFKTVTAAVVSGVAAPEEPPPEPAPPATVVVTAVPPLREVHVAGERRGYLYVARPPILDVAAVLDGYQKAALPLDSIQIEPVSGRLVKYGYNQGRTVAVYAPLVMAPFVDFPEDQNFRLGASAFTAQVEIQYVGGFRVTPGCGSWPQEVKDSCLRILAHIYRERDRKVQGVSSFSGQMGSTTRFNAHPLTDDIRAVMRPWLNTSTTARR